MGGTSSKLIVGITGATGTIFGVRLLQVLQGTEMETHLPLRVIKGAKDGTIYGLKNFAP